MKNQIKILVFSLVTVTFVTFGTWSIFSEPQIINAGMADNLRGYAWSSNIGWISFNSKNGQGANYGVDLDIDTGFLSGQAWSSDIGWLSFDTADLSGCPSGTCEARYDFVSNKINGWARFLSADDNGWDGWVSFGGVPSDSYSQVSLASGGLSGYAWGDDVVGWISFNGTTTDGDSYGVVFDTPYECLDGIDNDENGDTDYPYDVGCSSVFDDNEILYTHYTTGVWSVCAGFDPLTGLGGNQTRSVTSNEDEIPPNESEPLSSRPCDALPDFDFLDSEGVINNIYNSFVTFIGDQQKKFATPVQIIIDPVFENHPNPEDLIFVVTDVSLALPEGTDLTFIPSPLTPAGFDLGTQFDMDVVRTDDSGLYIITIEVTGGDITKQAFVNLNVRVLNPTFEEI